VATLSLRQRDLTGADLIDADIRQVDFSDAILNHANLGPLGATSLLRVGGKRNGTLRDWLTALLARKPTRNWGASGHETRNVI
jgi:Pentapeptide repeats (8 copies)